MVRLPRRGGREPTRGLCAHMQRIRGPYRQKAFVARRLLRPAERAPQWDGQGADDGGPLLAVEHHGYPKSLIDLANKNYNYGWASTKLAKYSLKKSSFDTALCFKLAKSLTGFPRSMFSPDSQKELYRIIQMASFMCGKWISSLRLLHPNL